MSEQTPHQLNMDDWKTLGTKLTAPALVVSAEYIIEPTVCTCGSSLAAAGSYVKTVVDVPFLDHPVLIAIRRRRYTCENACKPAPKQPLPDVVGGLTFRARRMIENRSLRYRATDVAQEFGVSTTTIRGIRDALVERLERGRVIRTPWLLGLDEKTIAGRERAVLVDLGRVGSTIVDILPSIKKKAIIERLASLPEPFRISTVVMDGRDYYRDAVHEALPGATIVLDRFHAERYASPAKRAPEALDAWRRLRTIWELPDPASAEVAFDEWADSLLASEKVHFTSFLRMWATWRSEMLAYFVARVTNAGTEWRNGQISLVAAAGAKFPGVRARSIYGGIRPNLDLIECSSCGALGRDGTMSIADMVDDGGRISWRLACRTCAPPPADSKPRTVMIRPNEESCWKTPKKRAKQRRAS